MSGGSYNYLCNRELIDLIQWDSSDLVAMSQRLAGLGYANDAARETEELLLKLRQARIALELRLDRLRSVWKAVEWWDSCDWGEDAVKDALAKYRGEPQ